jgi:hypothetical protein
MAAPVSFSRWFGFRKLHVGEFLTKKRCLCYIRLATVPNQSRPCWTAAGCRSSGLGAHPLRRLCCRRKLFSAFLLSSSFSQLDLTMDNYSSTASVRPSFTRWAVASLILSILAYPGSFILFLMVISPHSSNTAGVGEGLVTGIGLLSGVLSLLGVVLGLIALHRISRRQCGGKGLARIGIALGCAPLLFAFWMGGRILGWWLPPWY